MARSNPHRDYTDTVNRTRLACPTCGHTAQFSWTVRQIHHGIISRTDTGSTSYQSEGRGAVLGDPIDETVRCHGCDTDHDPGDLTPADEDEAA